MLTVELKKTISQRETKKAICSSMETKEKKAWFLFHSYRSQPQMFSMIKADQTRTRQNGTQRDEGQQIVPLQANIWTLPAER